MEKNSEKLALTFFMRNIDFLLRSNKEILNEVLGNRLSTSERNDLIQGISNSKTPDVTDISHREILIKFLFSKHMSVATLKLLLEKIAKLETSWENSQFLRACKKTEKLSIHKMNLLIEFYEKHKFSDGKINEQIYSYLVINRECVGSSTVSNNEKLLNHLFYSFLKYKQNNPTAIYDRIRFYEMISRKTKDSKILQTIFKEVMGESKNINIQKEAFRLRPELLSILFCNQNTPVHVLNQCIRLLTKSRLIKLCSKRNLPTNSHELFYRSFNKKSFYLMFTKLGSYDFKILFKITSWKETLTINSRINNFPNEIKNIYQRKFEHDLKISKNSINLDKIKR